MKRKLMSVLLAMVMLLTMLPLGAVSVFAAYYEGMIYEIHDDQVTITGHTDALLADLVIPNTIEGYPVTRIGDGAFAGCAKLVSVVIPDSVMDIGTSAFVMCPALSEVTMGNGVTAIGNDAFYECTALYSLTLSNSLTAIGEGVFCGCSALTSLVIPEGVTIIAPYAFYGCGLTSLTLPVSITGIQYGAFDACSGLKDVYYAGVESLSKNIAISDFNDALRSATWHYGDVDPTKGLLYEINYGEVTITGYTDDLPESLVIPARIDGHPVTKIGDRAFYNCRKLQEIIIPEGVTTIGEYAFYNCNAPVTVLPSTLTEIGEYAFVVGNWYGAYDVFYTGTEEQWSRINKNLVEDDDSYYQYSQLLEHFSNTVIRNGVVYTLENERAVVRASTADVPLDLVIPNEIDGRPVTAIYNHDTIYHRYGYGEILFRGAFAGRNLTSVSLPEGLTYIDSDTFCGCDFTSVVIPNSVTGIGGSAYHFADLASWETGAFAGCDMLETVVLSSNLSCLEEDVFENCTALTAVTIPDSVTSINPLAFTGCSGLINIQVSENNANYCSVDGVLFNKDKTKLVKYGAARDAVAYAVPEGVVTIEGSAFAGCALESVILPDSVETIATIVNSYGVWGADVYGAFSECQQLCSVVLGGGIQCIDGNAFSGCTSLTDVYFSGTVADRWAITIDTTNTCLTNATWHYNTGDTSAVYDGMTYEVVNNEIVITGYTDALPNALVIPDIIAGYPVVKIDDYAFYDCDVLTSVTIPNSVTTIGANAFYSCSGLASVTIPDSVTTIGANAFYSCSGLASVTISNSVTSIGRGAFQGCTGLASVIIPNSITTIDEYVFYGCSGLVSVTIPASVTSVGQNAFGSCTSLTSVHITDIAAWCGIEFERYNSNPFEWADDLYQNLYLNGELVTELIIPDGVTSIGEYAFYGCDSLASVTIPDSVTSIGYRAFSGCDSLASVTIPDSVTSMGNSVFSNCDALTSVIIGDSVTSIGEYAFYGCDSLISVTIPDSVTNIGYEAFGSCTSLTSVVIGDGVTNIGTYAFSGCTSMTVVVVGDSVTSIDYGAFSGCTSLTDVYYAGNKWAITIGSVNTCLTNATWHYNDGDPIKGLVYEIKNGEVIITGHTEYLPMVLVIPSTIDGYPVRAIGTDAFDDCRNLISVVIPDGVTSIGDDAFYCCTSLTSVTIPDSVTSIGYEAFSCCESLTSVTIPDSVTSIGDRAFRMADNVNSVYITDIGAWSELEFGGQTANPLHCGATLYLNGEKITDLIIPDGVTTIGDYAFFKSSTLTSVTIPDSVTSIGDYAFYVCTNLATVTIPDSVTSIGYRAFEECNRLTNVTIPDSVTSIGSRAFCYCTSLPSVTIPNGITSIGNRVFYYCPSLTFVTIPASVTSIGDEAFDYCASLIDVYYAGTEADKVAITIGSSNTYLTNATWHYNSIGLEDHYYADVQHSVMDTENGNGLAFCFGLKVEGVKMNNRHVADLTNATINYLGNTYSVVDFGTVMTNNAAAGSDLTMDKVNDYNVIKVSAVYLQTVEGDSCTFATRIINIPDSAMECTLYARPYYIIEVDGEQVVIYGDVDSASCAEYM